MSDLIRPLSEACYWASQSFPGKGAIRQRLTVLSEIHGRSPSRVVPSSGRNCSDIHPPDIVDFESFAALPLLTRDLLRDCQADLISRLADRRTRNCLVT